MELSLHMIDYVVMIIFVTISFGIGIFYGVCKKQQTTEEYLLGDRRMHLLPVALSLVVTFQSASSVLGNPAEIYMYHTMGSYLPLGIILAIIVQGVFIVPLVHPLKLTSAYEYLERRYQSRAVQLLGATLGMLQTLLYMATVLYAPALALEAVANIPLWLSVVLIGVVGTLYTSLGGIKSVIWTDVFQFVVLYGGLIGILFIGIRKVGGIGGVFREANAGHRIIFDIIDPDPTIRHSVWSLVIGGFFMWLPNCCNQSAVQRMSSVRTVRESRISVFLNVPLILLFESTLMFVGLMLYAFFRLAHCDPIAAGYIDNANQIVPYFVMVVLQDVPGLAGIFVAALFSGSLSSLSSGINSMAANAIQDVIVNCVASSSQARKTFITKGIVILYGLLAVTFAYLAKFMSGPVTQIALTCMGATGSPVAGIMFLGAVFPQANYLGALTGGIVGIILNIWIAMGSFLYGTPSKRSPLNPTSACIFTNFTTSSNYSLTTPVVLDISSHVSSENSTTDSISDSSQHLLLYDISYLYFGLLGFLSTILVGISISLLTSKYRYHTVQPAAENPAKSIATENAANVNFPRALKGKWTRSTQPEYIVPCLRNYWQLERPRTKREETKEDIVLESR